MPVDVGAARAATVRDPEEPVLAHERGRRRPELPHPDVERVDRLVDGRASAGPGQDQQVAPRVIARGAGTVGSRRGLTERVSGVRAPAARPRIGAGGEGAGGARLSRRRMPSPRDISGPPSRRARRTGTRGTSGFPVGEPSQQRHGVLRTVPSMHTGGGRDVLQRPRPRHAREACSASAVVDDVAHVREDGGQPPRAGRRRARAPTPTPSGRPRARGSPTTRRRRPAAAPRGPPSGRISSSAPPRSRRTTITGCTTRWTPSRSARAPRSPSRSGRACRR